MQLRSTLVRFVAASIFVLGLLLPGTAAATGTFVWNVHTGFSIYDWVQVAASNNGQVIAAVDNNKDLFLSTTTGTTWSPITIAGALSLSGVAVSSSGSTLVASDFNGNLYLSTTTGAVWTALTAAGTRGWGYVTCSSDCSTIVAMDYTDNRLYLSTTTGATWDDVTPPGVIEKLTGSLADTAISQSGSTIVAAAQGHYFFVSTTTGATWATSTVPFTDGIAVACSSDCSHLVATGSSYDYLYLSTDGGSSWTTVTGVAPADWIQVAMSADGSKIAAVADASSVGIVASLDGGATWHDESPFGNSFLQPSVAWSGNGSVLVAADSRTHDIFTWTGVLDAPAVSVSAPSAGASVGGSTVTLSAAPSDAATSTANVAFYVDGAHVGSASASPYSVAWSPVAAYGSHNLYAVMESAMGNYATSSTISFNYVQTAGSEPWCSGPSAPGWNESLPNGGCGGGAQGRHTYVHAIIPHALAPSTPTATTTSTIVTSTQSTSAASAPASAAHFEFTRNLHRGMRGADVLALQRYLNAQGFTIAAQGPGAPGYETDYFGKETRAALIRFQDAHARQILAPAGLTAGSGYFGASTRAYISA